MPGKWYFGFFFFSQQWCESTHYIGGCSWKSCFNQKNILIFSVVWFPVCLVTSCLCGFVTCLPTSSIHMPLMTRYAASNAPLDQIKGLYFLCKGVEFKDRVTVTQHLPAGLDLHRGNKEFFDFSTGRKPLAFYKLSGRWCLWTFCVSACPCHS